MEINKKDYDEITRLIKVSQATPHDVASMENIIQRFIDKHMIICRHCPAQIRAAHKRLSKWWHTNGFKIVDAETPQTETIVVEDKVDTKPKAKRGRPCTKCKNKK